MSFTKILSIIVRNKKEVYYPLLTIVVSFFLYWIISLFIEFADSYTVFPFFLVTCSILFFIILFDIHVEQEKNVNKSPEEFTEIKSKFFLFYIIIPLIIFSVGIIEVIVLLIFNLMFMIPIVIHLISIIMIYFFLSKEVKRYYMERDSLRD